MGLQPFVWDRPKQSLSITRLGREKSPLRAPSPRCLENTAEGHVLLANTRV